MLLLLLSLTSGDAVSWAVRRYRRQQLDDVSLDVDDVSLDVADDCIGRWCPGLEVSMII
jgi:hypothetical protein